MTSHHERACRIGVSAVMTGCLLFCARTASAAPPWVDRGLTLPARDWAFDVGLGIGHDDGAVPNPPPVTGLGINASFAVSPVESLELGFRTGFRLTDDVRSPAPDEYARMFDRQTFGVLGDPVANPEFRITGRIVRARVVEIGLEGRITAPIERFSDVGVMFGMPFLFHFGHHVRLDTGFYIPIVFDRPNYWAVSLPFQLWFQVTRRVWLGPLFGVKIERQGDFLDRTEVELGFGFGYQMTKWADFKAMILTPHINEPAGARDFGLGAGVQLRIE